MSELWVSLSDRGNEELVNLNAVEEIYVVDKILYLAYMNVDSEDVNSFTYDSVMEAKYYFNEIKKMLNVINIKPFDKPKKETIATV